MLHLLHVVLERVKLLSQAVVFQIEHAKASVDLREEGMDLHRSRVVALRHTVHTEASLQMQNTITTYIPFLQYNLLYQPVHSQASTSRTGSHQVPDGSYGCCGPRSLKCAQHELDLESGNLDQQHSVPSNVHYFLIKHFNNE